MDFWKSKEIKCDFLNCDSSNFFPYLISFFFCLLVQWTFLLFVLFLKPNGI